MKGICLLLVLNLSSCVLYQKEGELKFSENAALGAETSPEENEENEEIKVVSFEDVKQKVLIPLRCTGCHIDMNEKVGFDGYLVPGEPFDSKVYLRVENESMPPFGPKASKEQLELVEAYIRELNS